MGKSSCVVLFAKLPILGFAKSRIAQSVGNVKALDIYKELLGITSDVLKGLDYYVFYAGGETPELLYTYFSDATEFIKQSEGNLGEKLKSAFNLLYSRGYSGIVCIGADSPYVTGDDINFTISKLESDVDVVVGPAQDGGYYLVGCQKEALPIFDVTSWSSSNLLADTLGIVERHNLKLNLLKKKSDIDTIEDYIKFKSN